MLSDEFSEIEVDIDAEILCRVLEVWVRRQLDDPSIAIFQQIAEEVGIDLPEIQRAVGAAVMNQIMIDALTFNVEKHPCQPE